MHRLGLGGRLHHWVWWRLFVRRWSLHNNQWKVQTNVVHAYVGWKGKSWSVCDDNQSRSKQLRRQSVTMKKHKRRVRQYISRGDALNRSPTNSLICIDALLTLCSRHASPYFDICWLMVVMEKSYGSFRDYRLRWRMVTRVLEIGGSLAMVVACQSCQVGDCWVWRMDSSMFGQRTQLGEGLHMQFSPTREICKEESILDQPHMQWSAFHMRFLCWLHMWCLMLHVRW